MTSSARDPGRDFATRVDELKKRPLVILVVVFLGVLAGLTIVKDFVTGTAPWLASLFTPLATWLASTPVDLWSVVLAAVAAAVAATVARVSIEVGRRQTEIAKEVVRVLNATAQSAAAIVERGAQDRSAKEFADDLIGLIGERSLPGLRALSPARVALERDLFAAILELQTDRTRSGDLGNDDPYERTIQAEVLRWWNEPQSLSDGEVGDLARRVRSLIDYRMKRG